VCVCVCVLQREREEESVCVCVLQRERERERSEGVGRWKKVFFASLTQDRSLIFTGNISSLWIDSKKCQIPEKIKIFGGNSQIPFLRLTFLGH
jgi:hypothetical protein